MWGFNPSAVYVGSGHSVAFDSTLLASERIENCADRLDSLQVLKRGGRLDHRVPAPAHDTGQPVAVPGNDLRDLPGAAVVFTGHSVPEGHRTDCDGSRHSDHLDKATAMANSPTLYSRVMSVADRRMVCHQLSDPIDEHAQFDTDMPIWRKCHVDGHRIESPVLEQGH